MDGMKDVVIVNAEKYESLVRDSEKVEVFINTLINSIRLDYRGEDLHIDNESVIIALQTVASEALAKREEKLREKWKKDHEEDEE